jgi:hypothetical protein
MNHFLLDIFSRFIWKTFLSGPNSEGAVLQQDLLGN